MKSKSGFYGFPQLLWLVIGIIRLVLIKAWDVVVKNVRRSFLEHALCYAAIVLIISLIAPPIVYAVIHGLSGIFMELINGP